VLVSGRGFVFRIQTAVREALSPLPQAAELERLGEWQSLDRPTQVKLLFTALFHDSGKPATTELDSDTGRARSPKHAPVGAKMVRRVLRELECDGVPEQPGVRPHPHSAGNARHSREIQKLL